MALKLQCRCGQKLSVPESAIGKRGKCPKCGASFVTPAPKAAAVASKPPGESPADLGGDLRDLGGELDDLLDEAINAPPLPTVDNRPLTPTKSSKGEAKQRTSTRAQFTMLANGIKLVFWGTLLVVGSVLLSILSGLAGGLAAAAIMAAAGMVFVGGVLSTIGRVMCLAAPDKVGAKWLIYVAVSCDLAGVATRIAGTFTTLPAFVGPISSALSLGTLAFFVLFLKAVATYIKQERLTEDAVTIFVAVAIAITSLLMAPFTILIFPLLPLVFILLSFGAMIYSVYKYLNLLQHVAESVRP
jgi:hypothetical protein